MSTRTIIKLAAKFEKKYNLVSNAATAPEKIKEDISNQFYELMQQMNDDNVSVSLTLERESNWFQANKIVIKSQVWSETATDELKAKYKTALQDIITYVNKVGMNYEGGPWTFILP